MNKRVIAKVLIIGGILTVLASVLVGFTIYDQAVADEYDKAAQLYLVKSKSELFRANYAIKKDLHISNLVFSLSLGIGGFISGLLLVCLGTIVKFKQG